MGVNALVKAVILGSKILEEEGHRVILVWRAVKGGREAAPGFCRPYLGVKFRCTTDTSDMRTCEITTVR